MRIRIRLGKRGSEDLIGNYQELKEKKVESEEKESVPEILITGK